MDFMLQTPETNLGIPMGIKLAREIRLKVLGGAIVGSPTLKAVLPAVRQEFCAAYYNGVIYAFGGGTGTFTGSTTIYAYDIALDTWSLKTAVLPRTIRDMTATALNGKIYIVGGWDTVGNTAVTDCLEYDPAADTLTTKTALPNKTHFHMACTDGVSVYAIGGNDDGGATTAISMVTKFNPTTNVWTPLAGGLAQLPVGKHSATCEYYNGKIYIMGGVTSGNATDTIYIYDVTLGTWSLSSAVLPAVRQNAYSAQFNGKVYVMGGGTSFGGISTTIYIYNISTGAISTSSTALLSARAVGAYAQSSSGVYLLGGYTTGATTTNMYVPLSDIIGTVKLYADRSLKFTGSLIGIGDIIPKVNKFKLSPECRGESFHMLIEGLPGISMQAFDAAITEFKLLPKGAG